MSSTPSRQPLENPGSSRRNALKLLCGGAAAAATLTGGSAPAQAASLSPQDTAFFNFALNLKYLQSEFYVRACTGTGIEKHGYAVKGLGPLGQVTIKDAPQVPFLTDPFRQIIVEIADDEMNHVEFLRTVLGKKKVVARPALNLLSAFSAMAQAAGIVAAGAVFDPFLNQSNFLIAAFLFEDLCVTALKGGIRSLTDRDNAESIAGILSAESYHASMIRTLVYQIGGATGSTLRADTASVSNLRDLLDNAATDLDQGVLTATDQANIVPTDADGLCFSRTTREVLNVLYLDSTGTAHAGGFFPVGLNGDIR